MCTPHVQSRVASRYNARKSMLSVRRGPLRAPGVHTLLYRLVGARTMTFALATTTTYPTYLRLIFNDREEREPRCARQSCYFTEKAESLRRMLCANGLRRAVSECLSWRLTGDVFQKKSILSLRKHYFNEIQTRFRIILSPVFICKATL